MIFVVLPSIIIEAKVACLLTLIRGEVLPQYGKKILFLALLAVRVFFDLIQLEKSSLLENLLGCRFLNEKFQWHDIPLPTQQQTVGLQPIPPSSAALLVVILCRMRHPHIDNKSNILLIDPHSKAYGSHDNLIISTHKSVKKLTPVLLR